MGHRFFLWFVFFFGMLSIFGIYLGYLNMLYPSISFFLIVFSAFVSYLIAKKHDDVNIRHSGKIIYIVLFLFLLDIYISLPWMIYPHSYVDFGINVEQGRMITQIYGFPTFVHVYPNIYYGVFAIFNSFVMHAYTVSSIIAIVMQMMTVFAIFLLSRVVFNEKIGLIASFLYGFSLINIMLLEQGYLPQNFATFFFVASMYFIVMCTKDRSYAIYLVLSLIGLFSYPHYFAIMFFVIIFYFRNLLKYVLIAFVFLSIEVLGLASSYMSSVTGLAYSFVMNGGILVPNLFVLSVFFLGGIGFFHAFRKNGKSPVIYFTYTIGAVITIFLIFFLTNMYVYTWRTPDIRQLYIPIKLIYLFLAPISILAALFLYNSIRLHSKIVLIFLALYFTFFVNYSLILNQKNNLPGDLYFASEFLSNLNQNNSLGFDQNMLQHTWKQPLIYDTLYGKEDNYTIFSGYELSFLLQSNWIKGPGVGNYRSADRIMLNYTSDDVDYFVTERVLNRTLYSRFGNLFVYDVRR